jgi:glycine hydroxymethyltransferase
MSNWIEKGTKTYFKKVRSQLQSLNPEETIELILSLIKEHEKWIDDSCLNLYAASNLMSPTSRSLLSSSIATRVAEGHPGSKHQKGTKYIEKIEAIVIELAKKLFRANYVECRVLSGSIANLTAFTALAEYGDTIMALTVPCGGHISYRRFGAAGFRGLKIENIPFNESEMNIDIECFQNAAEKIKPKIIVLGASLILFPFPINEIRKTANEIGAYILYDGAHVDGLIAGKQFQDPLDEGADLFTSSTYKTLGGPAGGLILSNDEGIAKKIDKTTFPGLTANVHYHRLAATAVTLAELLEFGEDYATQVISNAKQLGRALDEEGFNVLAAHKNYTKSHQVVIDISSISNGHEAANRLEESNIICNSNLLPRDSLEMLWHPSGLRLGVQEVTKLGMKESEMREIAKFIRKSLIDCQDTNQLKREVTAFRTHYRKVHFCF